MSISEMGPMLRTWMFTSMWTAPPEEEMAVIQHNSSLDSWILTSEVWPQTVVIIVEEVVKQDRDIADCLVGGSARVHCSQLVM